MSIESTNSLSDNFVPKNKAEISFDFSFDEKNTQNGNASSNSGSGFSPNYSTCK